jgi:hypothetical protein
MEIYLFKMTNDSVIALAAERNRQTDIESQLIDTSDDNIS